VLQGHARALQDLVQMLPFVAALAALAMLGRSKGRTGAAPAGLGVHAEPE
jgi:ABC-type uncharacterized transport system permease subunit